MGLVHVHPTAQPQYVSQAMGSGGIMDDPRLAYSTHAFLRPCVGRVPDPLYAHRALSPTHPNHLSFVLPQADKRRAERVARRATEDFDAEEAEQIEVENEAEEELFDQVG